MDLPNSWRRMRDDLVESTRTWAEGLKGEMSFLSSRLKEFWADPEKALTIPMEQENVPAALAGVPVYLGLKGIKESTESIRNLFEGAKKGEISPEDALSATMLGLGAGYPGGASGAAELGVSRKVAVQHLGAQAKAIMKVAESATDPYKAQTVKAGMANAMKEVVPAIRKVKQEIWDPIPDVRWKFFKEASKTTGDIDIDKTMLMRIHPYKANAQTVFHEAGGHGLLVKPTEAIKKAQVEYKGELVPATEVMDYIYQVNLNWRGKKDYHTGGWYDKDPAEMLARTVAMDTARGADIEQAFLDRLPRVVKSFERGHPEVAEHYRTPLLERVAMKAFEKEDAGLPLLIQPKGAPKGFGKLAPVEERGELIDLAHRKVTNVISDIRTRLEQDDLLDPAIAMVQKGIDLFEKNPAKGAAWLVAHQKTTLPFFEAEFLPKERLVAAADYVIKNKIGGEEYLERAMLIKKRLEKPTLRLLKKE